MPNSYGYGATRNLTPGVIGNMNKDSGAVGNLSSLVVALGAAILARDETLHGSLVDKNATIFDGFGTFLTSITDMDDQYGQGGVTMDAAVAALGAHLDTNNHTQYLLLTGINANIFASEAAFYTGILAVCSELAAWKSAYTDAMTAWAYAAAFPSSAPLAGQPAAAGGTTATLTAEKAAFSNWMIAGVTPGVGNLHFGAGD